MISNEKNTEVLKPEIIQQMDWALVAQPLPFVVCLSSERRWEPSTRRIAGGGRAEGVLAGQVIPSQGISVIELWGPPPDYDLK